MKSALEIIGRHRAVFSQPPSKTPTRKQADGPLLGNGDVGVVLNGPPERLSFLISKNDFWKTKVGFPNCGPRAIGGFDLIAPTLRGASYEVEVDLFRAELTGTFSCGDHILKVRAWVAATTNVLVVEVSGSAEATSRLWIREGDESVTERLPDGALTKRYEGADLAWSCGAGLKKARCDSGFLVAVASSFDGSKMNFPTAADIEHLRGEHRRWWEKFWSESLIDIGCDDELERHYYGAQYLLASSCRNRDFPPGLWGNWITTDAPAWSGDYHINYNFEAPFWGLYSSNHLELADCYDAPLLDYIEPARRNAGKYLGVGGIYCEVGIGPRGFCSARCDPAATDDATLRMAEVDDGRCFLGQKSNAVFATVPMLMRWEHTRDLEYAARAFPYLIEVANFWEDYLRFEDGRYVIYNDAFREVGPWEGPGWEKGREDFNPLITVGLLHMFFAVMPEIGAALDFDAARVEKWRYIHDHLSELPLVGNVPRGAERGLSCEISAVTRLTLHGTIWPCNWVGERRTPHYFSILREAVSQWDEGEWHGGNSFDTVPPGAARLRIDPDYILEMMRRKIAVHGLPNLWLEQDGGGLETCGGMTAGINEMLLQSYEGVIRLFPCWPLDRDAAFTSLRACGAFLISAERRKGEVTFVKIRSEKGGDCLVENPWPDREATLQRAAGESQLAGETFGITLAPNEEILLHP